MSYAPPGRQGGAHLTSQASQDFTGLATMRIKHFHASQYANATSRRSKMIGVYRTYVDESNRLKNKLNNRLMYGVNRLKG